LLGGEDEVIKEGKNKRKGEIVRILRVSCEIEQNEAACSYRTR